MTGEYLKTDLPISSTSGSEESGENLRTETSPEELEALRVDLSECLDEFTAAAKAFLNGGGDIAEVMGMLQASAAATMQ